MRVLAVHGIGQSGHAADGEELSRRLSEALTMSIARTGRQPSAFQFKLAYWASPTHPVAQGFSHLEPILDRDPMLIVRWLKAQQIPESVAQGSATALLRVTLDWLARRLERSPQVLEAFLARFFAEVLAYVQNDRELRDSALARVRQDVREFKPDVVIAHSLGSVIAFKALSDDCHVPAPRLVTVGSPLGLVKIAYPNRTAELIGRLPSPRSCRDWHDFADRGDIVAIPRPLSRYGFRPDSEVRNLLIDPVGFHRFTDYLTAAHVAEAISAAAQAPSSMDP